MRGGLRTAAMIKLEPSALGLSINGFCLPYLLIILG